MSMATAGVALLVLPAVMLLDDPIFILAKYKLRLTEGSILYEFLKRELEGARIAVYLFNITNGPTFISGEDDKLKLQEVGPFLYQEYRSNKDVEYDSDAAVIRFTPQYRSVFLPEESVGQPEEFILNVPNISFLTMSSFFSTYPFLIKNFFNAISWQTSAKSIVKLDVNSLLWGYHDPLVTTMQSFVPGLVYFNSIGIFERLYDEKVIYRIEMGTSGAEKFQVKSIEKFRREREFEGTDLVDSKTEFTNTYEGAAFPPELSPETPLSVYRLGICKKFQLKYVGKRHTEFGADAFVYDFDNNTFDKSNICDSKGFCPRGMIDMSECFYGLPLTISKAHLLDSDASVERLAGLNPDREKHSSRILVDPKLGLTVGTSLALQLNMVLGDLTYSQPASVFSDMVLPVAHINITFPELPSETKSALSLMYRTGPRILLAFEIASCLLGLALVGYSVKLTHGRCRRRRSTHQTHRSTVSSHSPLKQKLTAELPLIHK